MLSAIWATYNGSFSALGNRMGLRYDVRYVMNNGRFVVVLEEGLSTHMSVNL